MKYTADTPKAPKRRPHWGRIFGVLTALALVIAAAVLLPGLLGGGVDRDLPQNADLPNTEDMAPADAGSADSTATEDPAAENPDGSILALWTQDQNRLSAYSEDGFYYLSHEKYLPEAMNIKYIDFATRQETFLCAVPNCTHDTDACTSYVAAQYDACEIFYAYDHLFLLNHSDGQPNSIAVCDPDGGNARTLLTLADGEALGGVYYGADRNHFYFVMSSSVQEGDNISYHKSLQALDLTTGALREVYSMEDAEFCGGSYDRYFYIRHLDWDNLIMSEYAIDLQGQRADNIHMPPDWTFYTKYLSYTNDGFIYMMENGDSCTIRKWDVRTGESTLLVEDFPVGDMFNTWFGAPTCGIMPSFYNPDLPDGSRGVYYYLIDIDTGAYVPTDMYFEDGGRPKLVSGQAEAGDYILVRTGFEDVPTWAQGGGFGDTRVPIYALISKEDYWAGIPNYIEITQLGA